MLEKMLEKMIAYHCAPALAGIKPSNIVSCPKSRLPHVENDLKRLEEELSPKGIYMEVLCECKERLLILVYRKKIMEKHLGKGEVQDFLLECGYERGLSVEEYLKELRKRFGKGEFPHEIGVFLGYPLHDIYGFMHHRDEGCLLVGEWKVYKDAESAKKLFLRYRVLRNALAKRVEQGSSLSQIFCVA